MTRLLKRNEFLSVLAAICLLGSTRALAQSTPNPFTLNYVPPSASAASLGKFGDIPVGLHTGIANISIPVFSYKGINNGLFLNVSLDYHAGGIRVEEVGGNMGMGWALSSGGVITRTMRGQPDDLPTYGYIAMSPVQAPSNNPDSQNIENTYVNNGYDSQQDEFDYNFNGHSGKFVLDGNGNPVLIEQQNVVIQHIPGSGTGGLPYQGFIATDENGVKYIFEDNETTSISVTNLYGTTYSSSWYLTAMITPFSTDTIKFTYTSANEYYSTFASETRQNQYSSDGVTVSQTANIVGTQGNTYTVVSKKIKKITCPNEVVLDFFYIPVTRCDLHGDSILSQIRQTDGITGATKSIYLYQSYIDQFGLKYTLSPAPCDTTVFTASTALRLRLDSVQEASGSVSKPPYVFQYNDNYLLPTRDSKLEDFWGYYNGTLNAGSNTLVPYYLYSNGTTSYFLDGADRRSDSNNVKAGSLTQIKYPTGGTTTFNYEVNRAGDNKLVFNVPEFQTAAFNFDNNDTTSGLTTITINQSVSNTPINFDFEMGGWCPGLPQVATIVFSITSIDGGTVYATESFGYSDVGTSKMASNVNIPNGSYYLTWQINAPSGISNACDEAFGFQLKWQYSFADSTQLAGGLRIASVVDYDGINHANDVTRSYSYLDTTGKSTGTSGSVITYGYNYQTCTQQGNGGGEPLVTVFRYFTRTATTTTPLCYTEGSSVTYSRVQVTRTGPTNVGTEVDYFTSFNDFPTSTGVGITFAGAAGAPPQPLDWALGLLTRQELYNASGQLVEKTVNSYNVSSEELDNLFNFKMAIVLTQNCPVDGEPTGYSSVGYFWQTGFAQKAQTTKVEYSVLGDSITNQVTYQYDPVYIDNVTQETSVDSKGDTVNLYHYYSFDYTISGSVLGTMVDSNIIAPRISNEIWKKLNGSYFLTSADATNYSAFSSGILPGNYYRLKSAQPLAQGTIGSFDPTHLLRNSSFYDQQISFDSYDTKENPTQIDQIGKITNYLWDINHQYPIAKVSNADTASIAYTSFEADGSGNWLLGSGTVDATTGITGQNSFVPTGNITKTGLSSATTYIVSYWTQGGPFSVSGTISGYPVTGKTVSINGTSWTLYVHKVTGQTTVTVSGSGHIDELRLYPSTAQMTTYTYAPLVGMTSQVDVGNRVTYYQYDPLSRLQRIRDQDYNILKTYQYQYQASAGCGGGCYSLAMQTFAGTNTLSYPVGVFDIHGNLVGQATNAAQYVSVWNSDTADSRIGTLAQGQDSMHFNLTLNAGQTLISGVAGLRFYQYDLAWNKLDGVRNFNAAYVDFGDGTGMHFPGLQGVVPSVFAPNTTYTILSYHDYFHNINIPQVYTVHTYADTSLKTITFYHNDDTANSDIDNANSPATSLTKIKNLRGNLPQNSNTIGGSSYQQSSALTTAGITNWNSISSVQTLIFNSGDGINGVLHVSYPQDFMQNNKGLLNITVQGCGDTTFRLSLLKSNWNTYFTKIFDLEINDNEWNREDLSQLTNLWFLRFYSTNPNGTGVIDNIINQIAAGAGQYRSEGVINITYTGFDRTSASQSSYQLLKSKNWTIFINGVFE
jgi:YD repeat-containing protein